MSNSVLYIVSVLISLLMVSCSSGGGSGGSSASFAASPVPNVGSHFSPAVDDFISTPEDESVVFDISANDDPAFGLSISFVESPTNGVLVDMGNGQFLFTPDDDFFGIVNFFYEAISAAGDLYTALVFIEVLAVNDLPVAIDDSAFTYMNSGVATFPAMNDSDIETSNLRVRRNGLASNGIVVRDSQTQISYYPFPNFCGSDSFSYFVLDAGNATDVAEVHIEVECTVPLLLGDDTFTVRADSSIELDVLANDPPTAAALDIVSWTQPASGVVSINANGDGLIFQGAGVVADQSFEYTTSDGSTLATWTVVVRTVVAQFFATNSPIFYSPATGASQFAAELFVESAAPQGLPTEIMGLVVSVALDSDRVTIFDFEPSAAITDYNGGIGPDLLFVEVSAGSALMSVMFTDALVNGFEVEGIHALATVQLETVADKWIANFSGGMVELEWGAHNFLALMSGETLPAATIVHELDLLPADLGTGFHLYAAVTTVPYPAATGEVQFDQTVFIAQGVSALPALSTQGFSLGLAHDDNWVSALSVEVGDDLWFLNGGMGPDFFGPAIYPAGVTIGVVFDLESVELLEGYGEKAVLNIRYTSNASTLMGLSSHSIAEFEFVETLGTAPVPLTIVVAGQSVSFETTLAGDVIFVPQ